MSSLPATPSESDFARNAAGNWVQNPFCCDFASEIAFALVWLDHNFCVLNYPDVNVNLDSNCWDDNDFGS